MMKRGLLLGVGRSCPCSTASSLLTALLSLCSAAGVCGRFVLRQQQQQQRWRSPHGLQTVQPPPLRHRQQSNDGKTYREALPLTRAVCINYGFMTNEGGWSAWSYGRLQVHTCGEGESDMIK